MSQAVAGALEIDVRDVVLSNSSFGPKEIEGLTRAVSQDATRLSVLRESVQELETREDRSPATSVRLGVCYYLLGRNQQALETLSKADGGALAHFYMGKACHALGKYKDAKQHYQSAKGAGYSADACQIATAETIRVSGDVKNALTILDQIFGPAEQTAEYLFQRGATIAAIGRGYSRAAHRRPVRIGPGK
jgi:DNA-directed RNA polymerase subunit alpha